MSASVAARDDHRDLPDEERASSCDDGVFIQSPYNPARVKHDLLRDRTEPAELKGLLCRALNQTVERTRCPCMLIALASGSRPNVAIRESGTVDDRIRQLQESTGIR